MVWPEKDFKALLFKSFLGIGVGLGMASLLYFLYILYFPGRHGFLTIQLLLLAIALAFLILQEQKKARVHFPDFRPSRVQAIFAAAACMVIILSLLSMVNVWLRNPHGDWDAWMMYNRTARFISRDQPHWLLSFSAEMDPIFHPDYPLLLPLNIVWGWDAVGGETQRVPIIQGGLFAIACAGLLGSALAFTKSVGQASIAIIVFWGTASIVYEGVRQMADVPLAFFILATGILIYLYSMTEKPGLLVLAGLTAGFAAWTKNEGSLFVLAAFAALVISSYRRQPLRVMGWYLLGLAFPLLIVLYFKIAIAPPSDVLSNSLSHKIQQATDPARHWTILKALGGELIGFGGWRFGTWGIGIIPVLLIYFLLFKSDLPKEQQSAALTGMIMLVLQILGYYAIYLITPYPLEWHLNYSLARVVLQMYPLGLFLLFCATQIPEITFSAKRQRAAAGH